MARDFDLPATVPGHVAAQLMAAGWSGLAALEHAEYLLFPSELFKRRRDGTFDRLPIMLRVPRVHEVRKARVLARAMAAEDGLDLDRDSDLVSDLETICLLSVAVRNITAPHEPMEPDPRRLEKTWDKASLVQAWTKLDSLYQVIDPAPASMTDEEMLVVLSKLVQERNLGPLAVYAPDARTSCIITMADRFLSLLALKS